MASTTYTTASSRWAAVSTRDKDASDSFVYAVRTTMIYCRPDCSSRLARRANILFFDCPALAESDGFRPCKRCKPSVLGLDARHPIDMTVRRTVEIIRNGAESGKKVNLTELSKMTGVSKWHLQRVFKRTHGVTPYQMSEAVMQKQNELRAAANTSHGLAFTPKERVRDPVRSLTSNHVLTSSPDHESVSDDYRSSEFGHSVQQLDSWSQELDLVAQEFAQSDDILDLFGIFDSDFLLHRTAYLENPPFSESQFSTWDATP